jgi:hypothetical protein
LLYGVANLFVRKRLRAGQLVSEFFEHRMILRITVTGSKWKVYANENMDRRGKFRNLSFAVAVSVFTRLRWEYYLWQKITEIAG